MKKFCFLFLASILFSCTDRSEDVDGLDYSGFDTSKSVSILSFRTKLDLNRVVENEKLRTFYSERLIKDKENLVFDKVLRADGEAEVLTLEDLVPEKNFRDLLSQDGEIIVNDTIYKITPQGTFFTHIDNRDKLPSLISKEYLKNEISHGDGFYSQGEVKRYDTFSYGSYEDCDRGELNEPGFGHDGYPEDPDRGRNQPADFSYACGEYANIYVDQDFTPPSNNDTENNDNPNYKYHIGTDIEFPPVSEFPTKSYKRQTVLGKFFQSIGIRNSIIGRFRSTKKSRLNAAVFDYNYIIRSSVGVTAKVQKKTALGLWWGKYKYWTPGNLQIGVKNVVLKYKDIPSKYKVYQTLIENTYESSEKGLSLYRVDNQLDFDKAFPQVTSGSFKAAKLGKPVFLTNSEMSVEELAEKVSRLIRKGELNPFYKMPKEFKPKASIVFAPNNKHYLVIAEDWIYNESETDTEITNRLFDNWFDISLFGMSGSYQLDYSRFPKPKFTIKFKAADECEILTGSFYAAAKSSYEWIGFKLVDQ